MSTSHSLGEGFGPKPKRYPGGPSRPPVRLAKVVPGIGRHAHRCYDPATGRKLPPAAPTMQGRIVDKGGDC